MGETRVDLLHLLEGLRDAYPGSTEETILTEIVANALDSGATTITITTDTAAPALTLVDDGDGMRRRELARYHDLAARSEEHTSELQSPCNLVCRLLLEKKKYPRNRARDLPHSITSSTISTLPQY